MAAISVSLSGDDWLCAAATNGLAGPQDLASAGDWLAAKVPGDVHSALLAAGRIPDPCFGLANEKNRWVEELDWWFKKSFALAPLVGRRAHLVFEGIDYIADIYLNDQKLGHHEGMFARQVYEVTCLLQAENVLSVRLLAAKDLPKLELSLLDVVVKRLAKVLLWADLFPDRLATLKCQMGFGWDFAPRMLTAGVWDDVYLHLSDTVYLQDIFVRSELAGEEALVEVVAEVDSSHEIDCEIVATVEAANFVSPPITYRQPVSLPAGRTTRTLSFRMASPRVWQPWDRGEQNLYRLRLEFIRGGETLDFQETKFGIRSITMAANNGSPRGCSDLTFVVNGQPEYIRGANWVPVDSRFARVEEGDYAELIALAKAAHVNMLRVWGGGLREKRAFYDLCDAEGIMVWQEFPLACAFFDHYPSDGRFVYLVKEEAEGIVKQIRNHPSLVVWCGGNEFAPARNAKVVRAIRDAVDGLDGSRPFFPASPGKGDGHNWRVWHGKANVRDYRRDESLLASEFGLQAAPDVSSLRRFLPEGALFPPGEQWEYHSAQLDKLNRYAAPFSPQDLNSFVEATQKAQAVGLQVAVEHFRRRKGRTSGVLFWQLNEPWPAICWSVIDYYRQPKLAYHKLKDIYNPVLVSLDYPLKKYRQGDRFVAEIWAINDLLEPFDNCQLRLLSGRTLVHSQALIVPPNSCQLVGQVDFTLTEIGELTVQLVRGEQIISRNSYDLSYFDPVEISRWDAMRNWIAWRVLK